MRNWKTTAIGLLILGGGLAAAWADPAALGDERVIAQIAAGIGFIVAGDAARRPKP